MDFYFPQKGKKDGAKKKKEAVYDKIAGIHLRKTHMCTII